MLGLIFEKLGILVKYAGPMVPVNEDEQDLDDGLEEVDGEGVYRLGSFALSSGTFCG